MRKPKVEIKEAKPVNGQRRWIVRLVAANGKILMTSETVNSKLSAIKNLMAADKALREGVLVGFENNTEQLRPKQKVIGS